MYCNWFEGVEYCRIKEISPGGGEVKVESRDIRDMYVL